MKKATTTRRACKCSADSPFHWHENRRDSFAMSEKSMRALGTAGNSAAQNAAKAVHSAKKDGKVVSTIHGISRNREAELTRLRDFKVYSKVRSRA